VPDTSPLMFDPAAAQAWLRQPSDEFEDMSRAESLGVDDELTAPGVEGFLNTVDDVLAAPPDGLHRYADAARRLLTDGLALDAGA
jgi:hypothetical protein